MKTFDTPEINIIRFTVEDILTVSDPNELPITPFGEINDNLGIVRIK